MNPAIHSLRQNQLSRRRDAQAVALIAVLNPDLPAAGEEVFRLEDARRFGRRNLVWRGGRRFITVFIGRLHTSAAGKSCARTAGCQPNLASRRKQGKKQTSSQRGVASCVARLDMHVAGFAINRHNRVKPYRRHNRYSPAPVASDEIVKTVNCLLLRCQLRAKMRISRPRNLRSCYLLHALS